MSLLFFFTILGTPTFIVSEFVNTDIEQVSIIFGGDVSFTGIQRRLVQKRQCTYNSSFEHIRPYLHQADEVFINLETPVANAEDMEKLPRFKGKNIHLVAEEKSLKALK